MSGHGDSGRSDLVGQRGLLAHRGGFRAQDIDERGGETA